MTSLRASLQGIAKIDNLREQKGWTRQAKSWQVEAHVSLSTLKRFWQRLPIQEEAFISICQAVGEEHYKEIIDQITVHKKNFVPAVYDDYWVEREPLTTQLITKVYEVCRVLLITGITGIGKTAISEKIAVELQGDFTQSIRINLDHQEKTDFASVATYLLTYSGDTKGSCRRACGFALNISQDPENLLKCLVSYLRQNSYLVLIDSLEVILKANTETGCSDFQDEWWENFFQKILSAESCKSRLILTSQQLPGKLVTLGFCYQNFWHSQPLTGLRNEEQLTLFEKQGLDITESSGKDYLERIGRVYQGHPLALRVIAHEIISHPFYGNIIAYWQKYGDKIEEVERGLPEEEIESVNDQIKLDRYSPSLQRAVKKRIDKTFLRLARDCPSAYILLCLCSVYRRPVSETFWWKNVENLGWNQEKQLLSMDTLRDRYLIEEELINDRVFIRQHNLIRSCALVHLKNWNQGEKMSSAVSSGLTFPEKFKLVQKKGKSIIEGEELANIHFWYYVNIVVANAIRYAQAAPRPLQPSPHPRSHVSNILNCFEGVC